ncbi:DUF2528 family protein [Halomonas sp. ISL-60]|uniref:DUF2528 family protein n=1 Tax=Halomonas sp. ISL-56 TaxID=2819149 RepID=UPI001BE572E7|nr:DUF2528 family protein [Halomonas sp. ISL-56]MBT2773814.1 DUF2528 family protein [Halomonas sp. ISL-60]MBT2800002.1 DUF2528 family protein [Halomonas sp. ISL-56]
MEYPTKPKQYAVDVRAIDTPEAQLVFTIDYTRLDESMAKEVVGFHSDKDDLRRDCDGDLEKMLILKTVQWAYGAMVTNDWKKHGLNDEFDEMEGWPGGGIIKFRAATYDRPEIEWSDLTVTETDQDAPTG